MGVTSVVMFLVSALPHHPMRRTRGWLCPQLTALVGSGEGTTIFVASFVPDDGPYEIISTSPPEYIAQVKDVIVPNPVSGPGVIEEVVDTDFFTVSNSSYTAHTFHEVISQPLILTNGLCQRNLIYFNQTFTDPIFRNGTVTLYSPGGAFAGVYDGVQGYSASGEVLGYNPETCSSAAENTDPMALAWSVVMDHGIRDTVVLENNCRMLRSRLLSKHLHYCISSQESHKSSNTVLLLIYYFTL